MLKFRTLLVLSIAALSLAAGAGCPPGTFVPDPTDVLFRDEFNGTLAAGWEFLGADQGALSLSDVDGFAHLVPQPPDVPAEQASSLLREFDGDFILTTRMRFRTVQDLELAGLLVTDAEGRSVALGLLSASGELGTFRGVLLRADRLTETVRTAESTALEDVYLRLERIGSRFSGAFSADGATYTALQDPVFAELTGSVRVGIGVGVAAACTRNCDQDLPADFDFFEISEAADGEPTEPSPTQSFRDEFTAAQLAAGWEVINENPQNYTLSQRSGFLRILTERGALTADSVVRNLIVREVTGNFILETRLEFDPGAGQQFAGLLVYASAANAAALGLGFVSGERGEFRGLALVTSAGNSSGEQPPVLRYDETTSATPNAVWLRLLRSGEQLVAGYSVDGVNFSDFGSVTNAFPETVSVGVGAANGDFAECGADCDTSIPADFDFFQILSLGGSIPGNGNDNDNGGGEPQPMSLRIDGPDAVTASRQALYSAVLVYDDESTEDVTADAEWLVGPPQVASIDGGTFTAADVTVASQATIVAQYTPESGGGEQFSYLATKLVLVAPSSGPNMCGAGVMALLPVMILPLWWIRGKRRR